MEKLSFFEKVTCLATLTAYVVEDFVLKLYEKVVGKR